MLEVSDKTFNDILSMMHARIPYVQTATFHKHTETI